MTDPYGDTPIYTEAQLAAARDQVTAPLVGTGPAPEDLTAKAQAAIPTEVDVAALIRQMQAQQDAMAAQIAALQAGQPATGVHPLLGTATEARGQLQIHFDTGGKGTDTAKANIMRLADDLV